MKDPKDTLALFCASHSPHHDDAAFLLGRLEPYFRRAMAGEYRLRPAHALDTVFVRAAAGRVTGRVIDRIEVFPREALHCANAIEGGHDYTKGAPTVIERRVVARLKTALWERYNEPLVHAMGSGPYHVFSEAFMGTLGEPLWHAFESHDDYRYWAGAGYNLMLDVRSLVLMAALALVGHLIWGDQDHVCGLHPLLEALTTCIPYGTDGNGTLLVIAE